MSFTDEEVAYLRSQRLARLATVSPDGQVRPRRTVHQAVAAQGA